jgi:hypothetical protein
MGGRASNSTVLLGVALAASACGAVNVRPYLTPFPDALVDTVQADPSIVLQAVADQIGAQGLSIHVLALDEGFLQTRWYETVPDTAAGEHLDGLDRRVRLRFFADPIGERQTQLTSEAVTLRVIDPSLAEREREVILPPDHPGGRLIRRILEALAEDSSGRSE